MESKFSGNVRNECRNSHAKFGGAALRYLKKLNGRGADIRPPPVDARVNKCFVPRYAR